MTNRRRGGKRIKRKKAPVQVTPENAPPPVRPRVSQVSFFVKRALGRHRGIAIR